MLVTETTPTHINKFAIAMALSLQPLVQTGEKASLLEMELQGVMTQPTYAKEERNGPPSANQGNSSPQPRHDHAFSPRW